MSCRNLKIPHKCIRVLIVDDHVAVRDALKLFLMVYEDLELIGEATNGLEAVQLCAQIQPDVVLMDLQMPGLDGISATRLIHQQNPQIRIIVLTGFGDDKRVPEAFEAGASNYLCKNILAKELADAIRIAHTSQLPSAGVSKSDR